MGKIAAKPRQRNKAIAFDYDFIRAQATDTCFYCLTDQQVAAIQTTLEYLGWRTRWFSLADTVIDQDWISAFEAELETRFMADECESINHKLDHIVDLLDEVKIDLDLSQTAQDVAIAAVATDLAGISGALALVSAAVAGIATIVTSTQGTVNEISDDVDNVETIVTASASEITETGADVDNIELLELKNKGNITNIYNQTTLINIGLAVPNLTYTTDTADSTSTATYARYNAFCAAIVQWIYTEEYAVLSALSAPPTDLATLALQMTATGLNLSGLASYGVAPFTVAEIYAAGNDTAAVNDVACAMINQLTSQKPAYETFLTALDAYVAPAYPDHRWILSQTVGLALAYLDAYTIFAGIYQDCYATALAAAPTAYDCPPCGTIDFGCGYQTWDFTLGQIAPWTIKRGMFAPGQGIVGVPAPGDPGYAFDIEINFAAPGCIPVPAGTNRIHFFVQGIPASAWNAWQYETYHLVSGVETLFSAVQWPTASYSYPTGYQQNDAWPNVFSIPQDITRLRFHSNTQFLYPAGGNWITPTYSAVTKIIFAAT